MSNREKYNNEEYRALITEFLGEVFYVPGVSYGTKIQKLRQYTEIVLRRILDYPCDKDIMIGHKLTGQNLDREGFNEQWFRDALKTIREPGNNRSHTKQTQIATKEEFLNVLDSLFDIYGYLFYKYFKKWPFGSNKSIESAFSCLPPIIRHIALSALFDDDPYNADVVEKLVLSKLKAYNKETADMWVEDHKQLLLNMSTAVDSSYLKQLIPVMGIEEAVAYVSNLPRNMYQSCKEKIQIVNDTLGKRLLYSDFESAKRYYEQYGIVDGDSSEVIEFNDLMEFVFIGRRDKEKEIALIDEDNYILKRIIISAP